MNQANDLDTKFCCCSLKAKPWMLGNLWPFFFFLFPLFPCSGPHQISQAGHTGQHHCCLAVSLTFSGLKQLGLFCFDFQSGGGVFIFLSKWETLLCM